MFKNQIKDQEIHLTSKKARKQEDEGENSSVSSLGRRSSRSCRSSAPEKCHRGSLVQVKSNDGDSHGDIYEFYLIDEGKKIKLRSSVSSRQGSAADQSEMDAEMPLMRRMSDTSKLLSHECQCDDDNCLAFHCSCYNEPNQMCLANSCCPNCIEMKIKLLQATQQKVSDQMHGKVKNKTPLPQCTRQHINKKTEHKSVAKIRKWKLTTHGTSSKNKMIKTSHLLKHKKGNNEISCSCKKSQCLKKYCVCYAFGKKCHPNCECQECQNHIELGNQQENGKGIIGTEPESQGLVLFNIDQFWEENQRYEILPQRMPESMQFQFPDLKNAYHI